MIYSENEIQKKIPKLIWQTYKDFPPIYSKNLIKSWTDLNPEYTWMYMDDFRCSKFIHENFSNEFSSMYDSLPLPVMKADVWRVAVIYAYGGIYADLDCHCIKPISSWLKHDDELVVGVEMENGALLNYIFAARPRHPALLSVLNKFMELFNSSNFMDKNSLTPVQNFGQHGFSEGILSYYNITTDEEKNSGGTTNFYNLISKVKEENTKFILKQDNIFSTYINQNTCVNHEVASFSWNKKYNSWRKQEREYIKNETD